MERITPYNKEDLESWEQQNEEAIQKIHDESLKAIINAVLKSLVKVKRNIPIDPQKKPRIINLPFFILVPHCPIRTLPKNELREIATMRNPYP